LDPAVTLSIGIAGCLFGSAFFSGSETALTSLSQPQIQRLIDNEGAKALKLWRDQPIRVLIAILIGNNIFNITASALATDLAQTTLGQNAPEAIPVAVGVMTFLLLTFGEITPKSIAKQWSVQLSGPIMTVMQVPYILFFPFTIFFRYLTKLFTQLLGDTPDETFTVEEIEYLVDLGSREGSFSEDRERLLRSVFEFPDTTVKEVMVPRTDMVTLSEDMDLDTVVDTLVECGHSRIPVYRETLDDITGLFYAKDVIRLSGSSDTEGFEVADYLREPYFVPESKGIAELLSEFQSERMHMAIVVDEFRGTAGLVTLEDIIEEFFGDIQDEYDAEVPPIRPIDETTARADARAHLDEVEEFCDIELPEEPDYESLGGFLMAEFGSVPDAGDEIEHEHVVFRILEADAKGVQTVEIERGEPDEPEDGGDPGADTEEEVASKGDEEASRETGQDLDDEPDRRELVS
jgi:CBS domain containing-hemolysin-like protein